MPPEYRSRFAFVALAAMALGCAITFGFDRLNRPRPVIISGTVYVPPVAQSQVIASLPVDGAPQEAGAAAARKSSHTRRRSGGRKSHMKITSGVIHINSATLDQLEELPGVGPSTAQAIIDFRTQSGGFQSIDDLGDVPRMSAKKLAKLMPFVAL